MTHRDSTGVHSRPGSSVRGSREFGKRNCLIIFACFPCLSMTCWRRKKAVRRISYSGPFSWQVSTWMACFPRPVLTVVLSRVYSRRTGDPVPSAILCDRYIRYERNSHLASTKKADVRLSTLSLSLLSSLRGNRLDWANRTLKKNVLRFGIISLYYPNEGTAGVICYLRPCDIRPNYYKTKQIKGKKK